MDFSEQSLHLFQNLSMIGWNWSSFIHPSRVGKPRYLLPTVSVVTPRKDLICSLVSTGHTSLKRTEHLLALSSWLVHSWKLSKTLFMVSACYETTLKLIKLSSANNKFEILGMFLAILMGVCLFSIISFLKRWTSPSAMNRKRYGLRGSPCETVGWVERF